MNAPNEIAVPMSVDSTVMETINRLSEIAKAYKMLAQNYSDLQKKHAELLKKVSDE